MLGQETSPPRLSIAASPSRGGLLFFPSQLPSKSAEKMLLCNRLHLKFILGVKYNIFANKILKY